MKKLISIALLALLSNSSFANSIQLGSAIDRISQNEYQDISVTEIRVSAVAFTADSNPKVLGQWKKCYTRELNMPPMPLQKYVYKSFSTYQDVKNLFVINNDSKRIEVEEVKMVEVMKSLEEKLKTQTRGKCTLDVHADVNIEVFVKEINATLTGRFFLTKENDQLSVYFGEWKSDMSGIQEIKELLPNKTPFNISFPY